MAKLNILGAQRVKALTEVLDRMEREAVVEVKEKHPMLPLHEARLKTAEHFGVAATFRALEELEKHIEVLEETLKQYGYTAKVVVNRDYSSQGFGAEFRAKLEEIENNGRKKELARVKQEFAEKKTALWLCETLEEAKSIVFGDSK